MAHLFVGKALGNCLGGDVLRLLGPHYHMDTQLLGWISQTRVYSAAHHSDTLIYNEGGCVHLPTLLLHPLIGVNGVTACFLPAQQ